jgi:hypothetical protein
LFNDASVSVVIATADATNARRDLIIAQVRDAAYSGATNDARIIVVPGTPAAAPVDPSLASYPNALVLARVTVTAGKTSILTADITNTRTVANVSGKLPAFATSAAAAIAIPTPTDGQGYYLNSNDTGEGVYLWNGSAYRRPWNMPWGVVSSNSNISASAATSGTTELVVSTGTAFTAVANRNYQIIYSTTAFNLASGDAIFEVRLRKDNTAGTQLFLGKFVTGVPYYRNLITVSTVFTASAGSFTPVATFKRDFGSGTAQTIDITSMTVTDIGPSGAPA